MANEQGQDALRAQQRVSRDAWRAAGRRRVGGGLIPGLVLVLVGGYFLVRQAVPSIDADRLWPWGAIAIGIVLVIAAFVAPQD